LEADAVLLPSRSVKLSLPVEATLRELRVKEGDFVKKGDVLAVLYSPAESLERDRAEKERELAAFELKVSEKLRAGDQIVVANTPAEAAAMLAADNRKWGEVVRRIQLGLD
jgi:multidrug efflux pump subunit AcrA (membrane-fusion protein)